MHAHVFAGEALDASLKGVHSVLDSSHAAVAATDHCLVLLPQAPCNPDEAAAAAAGSNLSSSKQQGGGATPESSSGGTSGSSAADGDHQAVMVLFKFGAITFFNAPKWQEALLLKQLRPLTTNPVMKAVDQLEQEGACVPACMHACMHPPIHTSSSMILMILHAL